MTEKICLRQATNSEEKTHTNFKKCVNASKESYNNDNKIKFSIKNKTKQQKEHTCLQGKRNLLPNGIIFKYFSSVSLFQIHSFN